MEALEAFEKYVPSNVHEYNSGFDTQYMIEIPEKGGPARRYYTLDENEKKQYIDYSDAFEMEMFFSKKSSESDSESDSKAGSKSNSDSDEDF